MKECWCAFVLLLLCTVGCGTGGPARRSSPLARDSLTASCNRNPVNCPLLHGKEAGSLPGRAIEVASAVKAWEELDTAVQKDIEDLLVECAKWADAEVNRTEFGGRHPTREECDTVVGGTRENPVTRCMRLGKAKHALALQCT